MSEETFTLTVLASDKVFYKGKCEEIQIPAIDGYRGILARHEPMVTIIRAGEVKFKVDGAWRYAAVSEGFIEITPDEVVFLADTIELPEEIDVVRAERAKQRAEERLRQKQSLREYYLSQAALARAMARLTTRHRHS